MSRNSRPVVLSVKPKWCDLILSGCKTLEVRRGRWPQNEYQFIGSVDGIIDVEIPRTVYIYRSGKQGAIVGEFECCYDECCVKLSKEDADDSWVLRDACLTPDEFADYLGDREYVHGLVIGNLRVYDKPRTLADVGLARAPQSWCYAGEEVRHG